MTTDRTATDRTATDRATSNSDDIAGDPDTRTPGLLRRFAAEAVIGIGIGTLVVWTLITANGEVPFVYQGL